MKVLRIAHLSDPHFSEVSFHPNQFLTKEWLGNFNYALFRKNRYQTDHLSHLAPFLDTLGIDCVFITGDFTTTAKPIEFEEAARFVESFHKFPCYTLPGNHDAYTRRSAKEKRYYNYISHDPKLKETRVTSSKIGPGWWWIGLDCAVPTAFFASHGTFFPKMEVELIKTLASIPEGENVIVANHFPLFEQKGVRHGLWRADRLRALLQAHPQVKVYLHGHDHVPYILEKESYPLVINSGSCAHRPNGTFFLLNLDHEGCLVERCRLKEEGNQFSWVIDVEKRYTF